MNRKMNSEMSEKSFLAINVGNTHTELGVFQGSELLFTEKLRTHPILSMDDLRSTLHAKVDFNRWGIKCIGISSVVPEMTDVLKRTLTAFSVSVLDHRSKFSFSIAAESPETIGCDRLANAEAALKQAAQQNVGSLLIVDLGTATTFTVLNQKKQFLGGAIAAGLVTSHEALIRQTAQLFIVPITAPLSVIGKNTEEALQSGAVLAHASLVDGMITRFQEKMQPEKLHTILTGGLAELLSQIIYSPHQYIPHLTLKGISFIFNSGNLK